MPASRSSLAAASFPQAGGRRSAVSQFSAREAANFLVVAVGASAGGLDACRKLLDALPDGFIGMAFILVQHLDPNHESMMVELLADHTSMKVLQAADGMSIERGHLYVIPPGAYLSVAQGALHLVAPKARHGARLPFDFLLHSLADDYGTRAVCIVLSGTGTDGSLGLKSVKEKAGLVIVQKPAEAGYDGMPRSAIETGGVDHVLPAAGMPAALTAYRDELARAGAPRGSTATDGAQDVLPGIIELLREKTAHDFTRALIMKKTRSKSLPALARLAMAATASGAGGPDGHDDRRIPAKLRITGK